MKKRMLGKDLEVCGVGLGGVPKTMKDSCRGAKLGESLAVQGGKTPKSENTVVGWAKKVVSAS